MNITATYDEAMVKAMIAEAVAKERNSWPAEMEAMERQVNILSDALAESRRDVDAMIALARADERKACLEIADDCAESDMHASMAANFIRARNNK